MELRSFRVVGEEGERLDHFLAEKTGLTRTRAQSLISQGAVKVDGRLKPKNHRMHAGENVQVELPEPRPAEPMPQKLPVRIYHEDEDLAVVSKPAGMVVHPSAGHHEGTLVNALLYSISDLSGVGGVLRPGIVHRLDRDTSGLLVVAKNDRTHGKLQRLIKDRELKRLYLTAVHGIPASRLGAVEAPVGRDPADRRKMAVTGVGGRTAVTHFEVLRTFAEAAYLEVELLTGRTHQIRVHLSYIGHPVIGDPEYGIRDELEKKLGLERQFLHSHRISFPHPSSGEIIDIEDPLPEDLSSALRLLAEL